MNAKGLDLVTLGETMLRLASPAGETLENTPVLQIDGGGTESNLASALARLGLRTGWISRLPDNALGRRVVGEIRRHGVDTSRVIWASGERMGTYFIEMGRAPRPTEVIYDRAGSALSRLEPDEVDWAYVRQAQWLHLTGITPAVGAGPRRTVERAMREAAEARMTISFDVNYRARLWSPAEAAAALDPLLRQVSILFCGVRDAGLLFGTSAAGELAARELFERFRPRLVVVTEGEAGAVAYDGQEHFRTTSIPTETVDPIGTGDAFDAGFIVGYREGDVARGMAWGGALAALKRTYRGDVVWASRAQVQAVLDHVRPGVNR